MVTAVVVTPSITSETDTLVLLDALLIAILNEPIPNELLGVLSKKIPPLILTSSSVSSVLNRTPAILGSSSA